MKRDFGSPGHVRNGIPAANFSGSGAVNNSNGGAGMVAALPRRSTTASEVYCPSLVVFSGGTAFNSIAGQLRQLTTRVAHVLPVSDDGGSTAEIVRVLGGPAVGDIRSRCLRLADDSDAEARAVKRLLAHRLPSGDAAAAKAEWYSIVEGTHSLWDGMREPYKHMIRAFLVHFQVQILSHSTEQFSFRNGSIGNFFFAGARTFFRSLESAIFLFSRVARIPEGSNVLPAICTEERITLGAELADGSVIRGQNEISHPSTSGASAAVSPAAGARGAAAGAGGTADGTLSDVSQPLSPPSPNSLAACASPPPPAAGVVDKTRRQPLLPSPVRRVFYLSREGTGQEHEVSPPANPNVLAELARCDAVVYGIGSLYTSICPPLTLEGVGEAIACRPPNVPKIMMLNGSHDRETGSSLARPGEPMHASDVVQAVADALNRRHARRGAPLAQPACAYVTTLLVPRGGEVVVDRGALAAMGVEDVVEVESARDADGRCIYDAEALVMAVGRVLVERGVLMFGAP